MSKYEVGQTVVIKSWEELLEIGELKGGDIHHKPFSRFFSEDMRYLCGKVITVEDHFGSKVYDIDGWGIDTWMVKPYEDTVKGLNERIKELEESLDKLTEELSKKKYDDLLETIKRELCTGCKFDVDFSSIGSNSYIVHYDFAAEKYFIINVNTGAKLVNTGKLKDIVSELKYYIKTKSYKRIRFTTKDGVVYEERF